MTASFFHLHESSLTLNLDDISYIQWETGKIYLRRFATDYGECVYIQIFSDSDLRLLWEKVLGDDNVFLPRTNDIHKNENSEVSVPKNDEEEADICF